MGDFVRGLWGWRFDFWACGVGVLIFGLVGGLWRWPFSQVGGLVKNIIISQVFRLGGLFTWVFHGDGDRGVYFRGLFAGLSLFCWFLGVSQVLDHIVLYSFPWFGLGSFAGVNYQLNIINTIFYFIK